MATVAYSRASITSTAGGSGSTAARFRNPPAFMALSDMAQRDAIHEVQALLDHLLYHRATAPFISHRLLQRLVTSNPSPRSTVAALTENRSPGT